MKQSQKKTKPRVSKNIKKQKNVLEPYKHVIPPPSESIYKNTPGRENTILDEVKASFKIERIDGTTVYIEGAEFPKKGFPKPDAVWSANQAKKVLIESLRIFNTWQFILSFIFTWNKRKFIEKCLLSYNRIALSAIKPFILKRIHIKPVANEIGDMCFNFLTEAGFNHELSQDFATIFTFMIDIDDAYNYRLKDILSETTKEKIAKNPILEIDRLLLILRSREYHSAVADKFKLVAYLIYLLLFFPKYRKAFDSTLDKANMANLQYDEADRYWVLMKPDNNYSFLGKSYDERQEMMRTKYKKIPNIYPVTHIMV